ncbi:hypothetical protein, conserved [Eimeria tenella]|uniref:Uncharacterized protein n=1 Tax=Eimeria tenella TaxID=5802 RepID=U6KZT4_EIMTE|nr:hypothetical protein, conserved [Eimeria tenella]CDJ42423.1 hypothetical protein, conserved [Eimeria tenella]|eukprot:XP_013233173.1 hypothetical protein, conserved [Eimeria tenella]
MPFCQLCGHRLRRLLSPLCALFLVCSLTLYLPAFPISVTNRHVALTLPPGPAAPPSAAAAAAAAAASGAAAAASRAPVVAALLPSPLERLHVFSVRLAAGQLRRIRESVFLLLSPRNSPRSSTSSNSSSSGSSKNAAYDYYYPKAIADFLRACVVYYVADKKGNIIPAIYPSAHTLQRPATAAAAAEAAAAAAAGAASCTPAEAALSVGVFFMSKEDACAYRESIMNAFSQEPPHASISWISLADVYPLLRYVHPCGRRAAAAAAAAAGEPGSFVGRCMQRVLLQLQGRRAAALASRSKFVLLPSTQTLSAELKTKSNFTGIPVYSLLPVRRGAVPEAIRALKQQQQQQQQGGRYVYKLSLVGGQGGAWTLAVNYNGEMRTPVFCSKTDAEAALAAFAKPLPRKLKRDFACNLITVQTLESALDRLPQQPPAAAAAAAAAEAKGSAAPFPLLLPDSQELPPNCVF